MPWVRLPALAVALLLLAACGRLDGEAVVHAHNTVLHLSADSPVGQTFEPVADEVRRVDFLLATFGQRVRGDLEVTLRDAADGRALGAATISGRTLRDNRWTPARFRPPVPAPEVALVELRWTGTGQVGAYANVMPADGHTLNNPYPAGTALRDGKELAGDLAFAVQAGQPSAWLANLRSTAGRIVWGLRQAPLFSVVWVLLLAGAVLLTVTGARRARATRAAPTGPGRR